MSQSYFLRNVILMAHDGARISTSKLAAIMARDISQAEAVSISHEARDQATARLGNDYAGIWQSLKLFENLQSPLWIECPLGAGSTIGCLVSKVVIGKSISFYMRRFSMKNHAVLEHTAPVYASWTHEKVVTAKRALCINEFVNVAPIYQDTAGQSGKVQDELLASHLRITALMISLISQMEARLERVDAEPVIAILPHSKIPTIQVAA